MADTVQLSIRVPSTIHSALASQAAALEPPQQFGDHINLILARAAIASGFMNENEAQRLKAQQQVLEDAARKAIELQQAGRFSEHFTRDVVRAMMDDLDIRATYETAIDGDAYADKLEGKMPLNMYLGWAIKNAVGAEVQKNENGKPKRASVRGEPIQTYTLLDPSSA